MVSSMNHQAQKIIAGNVGKKRPVIVVVATRNDLFKFPSFFWLRVIHCRELAAGPPYGKKMIIFQALLRTA